MKVDISGWLNDLSSNQIYYTFSAQNHTYGCLTLLEQIHDGEVILEVSENTPVIIYKDVSGEFNTLNLYTDFHMVGYLFGFQDDLSGTFLGWSEEYRKNWLEIFNGFDGPLESIELQFYNFYKSRFSGKSAFEAVVAGNEITEEMKTVCQEAPSNRSIQSKEHRRREYTYRARRNTTPLYRRRGFNKTRKHSVN
jgi:hypothetical protein